MVVIAKPDLPSQIPITMDQKQELSRALAAVSVGCSHRLSRGGLFMPCQNYVAGLKDATLGLGGNGMWEMAGGGKRSRWQAKLASHIGEGVRHSRTGGVSLGGPPLTACMMRTALSKGFGGPDPGLGLGPLCVGTCSAVPALAREVRLS